VLASLALAGSLWALGPPPTEYEVKAAFLLNFGRFVEWPSEALPDARVPLTVGVLGEDPFGPLLDQTLKDKSAQGHPVVVRRLEGLDEARRCQILFVSASESGDVSQILRAVQGVPVLTVSEIPQFALRGGMVNFVVRENRVRFEINTAAATQARLKISSQLLKLALLIEP